MVIISRSLSMINEMIDDLERNEDIKYYDMSCRSFLVFLFLRGKSRDNGYDCTIFFINLKKKGI